MLVLVLMRRPFWDSRLLSCRRLEQLDARTELVQLRVRDAYCLRDDDHSACVRTCCLVRCASRMALRTHSESYSCDDLTSVLIACLCLCSGWRSGVNALTGRQFRLVASVGVESPAAAAAEQRAVEGLEMSMNSTLAPEPSASTLSSYLLEQAFMLEQLANSRVRVTLYWREDLRCAPSSNHYIRILEFGSLEDDLCSKMNGVQNTPEERVPTGTRASGHTSAAACCSHCVPRSPRVIVRSLARFRRRVARRAREARAPRATHVNSRQQQRRVR